jgi:acyl carrier protein
VQKAFAEERLFAVLSSILNVPLQSLSLDSSRSSLEAWDSLNHLYVVLALEEEFNVEFADDEIATLRSASSLRDALVAKTAERTA